MYLFFFKALVFVHCYITDNPIFFCFFFVSLLSHLNNITYPYINIPI